MDTYQWEHLKLWMMSVEGWSGVLSAQLDMVQSTLLYHAELPTGFVLCTECQQCRQRDLDVQLEAWTTDHGTPNVLV